MFYTILLDGAYKNKYQLVKFENGRFGVIDTTCLGTGRHEVIMAGASKEQAENEIMRRRFLGR
jgi:hypothetical protein